MMPVPPSTSPHEGGPVAEAGAAPARARAAAVLVHGRGASAESILALSEELDAEEVWYLAPQAAGRTWYPYSFLAPLDRNEPGLSSGLRVLDGLVRRIEEEGIPADRIVLLGFSQGACLALEYAARHARRFGGVVGWSGGLIGPDGASRDYDGSLDGTPVFLGCSDVDPHIPLERVHHTAEVMSRLGGAVTKRIYEGMGHTVNRDEVAFARNLLRGLGAGEASSA